MPLGDIQASSDSIEKILSAARYCVPYFQRGYSWEKEQVIQFWEDIIDLRQPNVELKDVPAYFIGAMVFEDKEDGLTEIIDGQQRLATITILLAAVRDIMHFSGYETQAQHVQNLIAHSDWHMKEEYIVTLGEVNDQFFKDFVQSSSIGRLESKIKLWNKIDYPSGKRQSNKLILDALRFFHESIEQELKNRSELERLQYLVSVADIITKKLKTVTIKVSSDADAFGVFETLNDRGIELSIPDLFKNHVFSIASKIGTEKLKQVRRFWTTTVDTIGERTLTRFLRHYWISRFGHVRQRELYDQIKKFTRRQTTEVPKLVQDIAGESETYKNLIKPTSTAWTDEIVLESLEGLDSLGVQQCYPLLLAANRSLSKSNYRSFCNFIEKLTFRYSTVCGRNPNRLEREYSWAAIELREKGNNGFSDVLTRLVQLSPDDLAFKLSFLDSDFRPKTAVARYMLRKIEMSLDLESPWEIKKARKVHVEHIMPKKLNRYWKDIIRTEGIEHERVLQRIGNLTLLEGRKNVSISNMAFPHKKKEYKKSKLQITEKVASYSKWNKESIDAHQEWLFEFANKLWSL